MTTQTLTAPTGTPRTNQPTVTCKPWCIDGDGHPDVTDPGDQTCWSLEARTPAILEGQFVTVYNMANATPTEAAYPPLVFLGENHRDGIDLTPSQARAVAASLIAAADQADGPQFAASTKPAASVNLNPVKERTARARPLYPEPKPFTGQQFDVETDPAHPAPGGNIRVRHVASRDIIELEHDAARETDYVPVNAVAWAGCYAAVEVGPWSMISSTAREFACSILEAALVADTHTELLTRKQVS